jgi:ribosomal-protein-alanine N-acetyltransferase
MESHDVEAVATLDANAFEPIWQLSRNALVDAQRQAATFTVAEIDNQIVGYQLSTWHLESGHLARLAISPDLRGQRIGQQLVIQMLHFFAERQVHSITVNTQADNTSSQKLYQRLGFQPTHHVVPVWETLLEQELGK